MLGELMGRCWSAQYEAEAALLSAERLEAIEREHERLIAIFEALEIDLDEESLATLELIGKREYTAHRPAIENSPYRDQRRDISKAFAKAIRETQENERDFEHDQATDAILAAGFVHDEENDCFARGDERVTVTLVNGRECRYEWTFGHATLRNIPCQRWTLADHGRPVLESYLLTHYGASSIHSGKSGEFSKLIALIAPASREVAQ